MATSDAQKRAIKAHTENLKAKGHRKVAFWLSPHHLAVLDRIAAAVGSRQRAVEHLINKEKPDG